VPIQEHECMVPQLLNHPAYSHCTGLSAKTGEEKNTGAEWVAVAVAGYNTGLKQDTFITKSRTRIDIDRLR
jgi:hypothetical protein